MPKREEEDGEETPEPAMDEKKKKKKTKMGSIFGKAAEIARKKCMFIYRWIETHSGKNKVLFYAIYSTCFWTFAIIYACFFPSVMDVGFGKYNQQWVWILCFSLCLPFSLIGIVGAWMRIPRLVQIYFVSLPVCLSINVGNTVTMARLSCKCWDYLQCSALTSFAHQYGEEYAIPFPVPNDIPKFANRGSFPWEVPPEPKEVAKNAASLEQIMVSEPKVHRRSGQVHNFRPSGRLAKLGMLSPGTGTESPGTDIFDMANEESGKGMYSTTSPSPPEDAEQFSMDSTRCRAPRSSLSELLFDERNSSGVVSLTRSRNLSFKQHLSSSVPVDMRRLYMFGPLKDEYKGYRARDNCTHMRVERTNGPSQSPPENFKAQVLACRRDRGKGVKTRCPSEVVKELERCVEDDSCGAVKIQIIDGRPSHMVEQKKVPATSDSPIEVNITAKKQKWTWQVNVCFQNQPVSHQPGHFTMNASDTDTAWDQANPLVLYFERDMTQTLKNGVIAFGKIVEPFVQARMNWDSWIRYMSELKKSGCHCKTSSESCAAYKVQDQIKYWCLIDGSNKELCQTNRLSGGDPVQIRLYEMPGRSDETGSKGLWSPDLCTTTKIGRDSSALEAVVESQMLEKPRCQCMEGTGFKVKNPEDLKKIRKDIVGMAYNKEEVLIGYKCDKWYEEDQFRWCIVGFDSACADKKPHSIDKGERLRVFTSSIPCQRYQLPTIIESASQLCRSTRLIWLTFEVIWYVLFPLMFAFVYAWLYQNCSDVAADGFRISHGWGAEDDQEDDPLGSDKEDEENCDSEYSGYSYSSDSSDSEDKSSGKRKEDGKKSKTKRLDSEEKEEKQSKKEKPKATDKKTKKCDSSGGTRG